MEEVGEVDGLGEFPGSLDGGVAFKEVDFFVDFFLVDVVYGGEAFHLKVREHNVQALEGLPNQRHKEGVEVDGKLGVVLTTNSLLALLALCLVLRLGHPVTTL